MDQLEVQEVRKLKRSWIATSESLLFQAMLVMLAGLVVLRLLAG